MSLTLSLKDVATGNLSYITKHGDARNKMLEIDGTELPYYLNKITKWGEPNANIVSCLLCRIKI